MKSRYLFNIQLKYPPRHEMPGNWAGVKKGVGFELWGLRKYVRGDSYRHIDWNARARTGELFVKEFSRDSAYTLLLICDVSPSMRLGGKLEFMTDIASSLAFAALRDNNPCGLLLYAGGVWKHLFPSPDPAQFYRVLSMFRDAAGVESAVTDLRPALNFMKVRIPSCLGVILSDFNYPMDNLEAVFMAAPHSRGPAHEMVAFHLLEDVEYGFDELKTGTFLVRDVETAEEREMDLSRWRQYNRFLQDRREGSVRTLSRYGIDSLVLTVGEPTVQSRVNTFFGRRMSSRV